MTDYRAQTDRIREKLKLARKSDPELREFGASEHGYLIGPPLTDEEVTTFEKVFEVTLPGCYRAFLTQVGNGSPVANHVLVSPEGIYPLTEAEIATYERNHGVSVGPSERAYLARVRNGIPIDNGCAPLTVPARDTLGHRGEARRHNTEGQILARRASERLGSRGQAYLCDARGPGRLHLTPVDD